MLLIILVPLLTIGLALYVVVFRNPDLKKCRFCKHWDLEEGQEAMRHFPSFMIAANHIPMAEMGRAVVGHDDDGEPIRGPSPVPMKARWDRTGACLCPAPDARDEEGNPVLRWEGDTCNHHSLTWGRFANRRRLPVMR